MKNKNFVIDNQIEKLSFLAEKIEDLAVEWKLPMELALNINLVIEEAITNIIFYAFDDKEKHKIKIAISLKTDTLCIEIKDNGIPFNPLLQKQPDINSSLDDRAVGGLGIFLITQIMDDVKYVRQNNQNILTLNKSL